MEELNLIYNNKNTLSDLGLTMAERPSQPIPTKRATKIEVPGRDGELNIYDGTYEPIEFSVEFNFRGLAKEDFLLKVDVATGTITTLTASAIAGEYILTVPAVNTGQILTLQLFDGVKNASIINLDGTMYKSNVATTVVV